MKKFAVIALALVAAFMFVVPAMATDVEFSGSYRARGWYLDNPDLDDDTGAHQAVLDHRLRIGMDFKVHDRLTVFTRFDALDGQTWGDADDSTIGVTDDDNFESVNWDRAYLEAKFDMFDLYVGRKVGGTAFTLFADTERDADRVQFKLNNLGDFTLIGFYEKLDEADYGVTTEADADVDEYALLGMYSQEAFEVGTILAYVRSPETATRTYTQERWIWNPYAKAIVGPVTLTGEGQIDWGDREYTSGAASTDVEGFGINIEAAMDLGPAAVMVGWAHVDGDDPNDTDDATFTSGGSDFEPLLILTWDDFEGGGTLGGAGNLNSASGQDWGYDLFYGRADFAPMENVNVYGVLGFATADEERAYVDVSTQDDDIGWEFDLGADVTIMDNLTYSIIFGYFDADDFFKGGNSASTVDDDTFTVFNQLQVKF